MIIIIEQIADVIMMKGETISYVERGEAGTDEALKAASEYAGRHDVRSIVVASTWGNTARKAAETFEGKNLVVVTHVHGFREPDKAEFPKKLEEELESKGVRIITAAHAFGGINKISADSIGEVVANTLRMFSQGVKVCVECATMAADAGLVRTDEDAIAIAGTGKGADTVLVLRPSNSARLFETKVRRILALPG